MAVKIPLAQRTEIGPQRGPGVKPPHQLADTSGQQQFGASITKFAGDTFNKIVATRAAGEEAEFQGEVNGALQGWETFLAGNPGASFEDMQKARDKMMVGIKSASQNATTGIAKQNNANWLTRNEELIAGKTQTSMEKIVSKQEFAKFQLQSKALVANFNKAGLADLTKKHVESGNIDPELAQLQLEQQFNIINEAQDEFEQQELFIKARATAMAFPTEQESIAFIDSQADVLSREQRNDMVEQVSRKYKYESTVASEALKTQQGVERDQVIEGVNDITVTDIEAQIKLSALEPDEQDLWIKKWSDRNDALNAGKLDPWEVDNPKVVNQLREDIAKGGTAAPTDEELAAKIGIGLSKDTYDSLKQQISDPETMKILARPVTKRGQDILERTRTLALKETDDPIVQAQIEGQFLSNQTYLDQWAIDNASDPQFTQKYIDEVNKLNAPIVEAVTLSFLDNLLVKGGRFITPLGPLFPEEAVERKLLRDKKLNSLQDQPVWDTLDSEEKKEAKQAFENGFTVQDVIDELAGK